MTEGTNQTMIEPMRAAVEVLEQVARLEKQLEQARNLACEYEEIIAWYRRLEPLRFSKKDAQHPDLVRRQQRV